MNHVSPEIEAYLRELAQVDDEPVLLEMEALAEAKKFPIIDRLCGQVLEVMARVVSAKRIFEMGSGYGYSAYWFSRATGPDGEIHLTDMDPENETKALDFLGRAGLAGPIQYHVNDAFSAFDDTEGEFDVIYCDIDKDGYPEAWRRAKDRVRVGGLYMCDNMLWSSRVVAAEKDPMTQAIDETNRMIANDPDWRMFILPTRDGVVIATRIH